jgi:transposase
MARPYSVDLRERVVRFVISGHSRHAAAAHFGVSVASAIKWVAAYLVSGEVSAKPLGGRRFSKLDPHRAFLVAQVQKQPDITMPELAAALATKGTTVDPASISRWLRRNNYRYKKSPSGQRTRSLRRSVGTDGLDRSATAEDAAGTS